MIEIALIHEVEIYGNIGSKEGVPPDNSIDYRFLGVFYHSITIIHVSIERVHFKGNTGSLVCFDVCFQKRDKDFRISQNINGDI